MCFCFPVVRCGLYSEVEPVPNGFTGTSPKLTQLRVRFDKAASFFYLKPDTSCHPPEGSWLVGGYPGNPHSRGYFRPWVGGWVGRGRPSSLLCCSTVSPPPILVHLVNAKSSVRRSVRWVVTPGVLWFFFPQRAFDRQLSDRGFEHGPARSFPPRPPPLRHPHIVYFLSFA